jgi:hypothetical protein
MPISESVIAEVITFASKNLTDASFVTERVGLLMDAQADASQYVVAHSDELQVDGVVQILFQAALVYEMIFKSRGTEPKTITFVELNGAIENCPDLETLARDESDLASYIFSNLDDLEAPNELAGKLLAHLTRAFLDA